MGVGGKGRGPRGKGGGRNTCGICAAPFFQGFVVLRPRRELGLPLFQLFPVQGGGREVQLGVTPTFAAHVCFDPTVPGQVVWPHKVEDDIVPSAGVARDTSTVMLAYIVARGSRFLLQILPPRGVPHPVVHTFDAVRPEDFHNFPRLELVLLAVAAQWVQSLLSFCLSCGIRSGVLAV